MGDTSKNFLERLTVVLAYSFDWQGHVPPAQILPSFKAPLSPGGALLLERPERIEGAAPAPARCHMATAGCERQLT